MIITIKHREVLPTKDGKNKYLQLTKEDGKKRVIFSDLYDKWELCQENATVELKLDPNQNFKVVDIIPVGDKLPPPQRPETPPEHQAEIGKAEQEVSTSAETAHKSETDAPKSYTDPRQHSIEMQVALKEVGELYRAGYLTEEKPVDRKIIAKYKNWIVKTLGVEVEYQ